MNVYFLIFVSIAVALLLILVVFYRNRNKQKRLKLFTNREPLKLSIIFVVKNNEKLLKTCINIIREQKISIYEIIVLDLGSIDKTIETAKELQETGVKITISTIKERTLEENYKNITRRFVTGDVQFIVDLYKLSTNSPQLLLPEIFKSSSLFSFKKISTNDRNLNIAGMLNLKKVEMDKNGFLLKRYIMEFFSNVSMIMDSLKENNKDDLDKYLEEIKAYIQKSTSNILLLLRIMGSSKFADKSLNDNIQNIVKEYSKMFNVEIYYEASGLEKQFKNEIGSLILNNIQEILYTIMQDCLDSEIKIMTRYGKINFYVVFRFKSGNKRGSFAKSENELGYYMLLSVQNWLSLINGELKLNKKNDGYTLVSLCIPINSQTCHVEGEKSYEE